MSNDIKIVTAILRLMRGETTVCCVAETFGVPESQVVAWKDVFQVAGVVALTNALRNESDSGDLYGRGEGPEPTTSQRLAKAAARK